MRKFFLVLVAVMVLLSGCGKENPENKSETPDTDTQQTQISKPEDVAFETVEPSTDEPIITEESQEGDYTSVFISKFLDSGTYYLKTNVIENGETEQIEMAVSGEKTAYKDNSGIQIVDGDTLYYVMSDQKCVFKQSNAQKLFENATNFILERQMSGNKEKLVSTGKEDIKGQELSYEEFSNEGRTIKYYYDDKTIRYVKAIKADGTEKLTQVLELTHTIPEGLFDIPSDYIVQDLSEME